MDAKNISILLYLFICLNVNGQTKDMPTSFGMANWVTGGTIPNTFNGWAVEYKMGLEFTGYTEGILFRELSFTCDTCLLLKKYTFNVVIVYGMPKKEFELTITQNKDTTDKYFKLQYPNCYDTN